MDLPLLSALFAAFALTLYVLLDGFDLGVGTLILFQSDERLRDRMIDSILPTWDGNETWLIMAGVTLLAAFPIAYGILLPAFYIPLIVMLLSLGLRGVSFEFRGQAARGRPGWDIAFGLGSIAAGLMQGIVVGGLVQGVAVDGERFGGGVFDAFRPFSCLVALALLTGYVVLGAGWLHLKATGTLRSFAERSLRLATPAFAFLAIVTCVVAALVQPEIQRAWSTHSMALIAISILSLIALGQLLRVIGYGSDIQPFALGLCLFALGILGLGIAIFPDIIPFRLSLWAAASSTESHIFVLVGAMFVTPVVLFYSAFAYWVFHGKTPEQGWEE